MKSDGRSPGELEFSESAGFSQLKQFLIVRGNFGKTVLASAIGNICPGQLPPLPSAWSKEFRFKARDKEIVWIRRVHSYGAISKASGIGELFGAKAPLIFNSWAPG